MLKAAHRWLLKTFVPGLLIVLRRAPDHQIVAVPSPLETRSWDISVEGSFRRVWSGITLERCRKLAVFAIQSVS